MRRQPFGTAESGSDGMQRRPPNDFLDLISYREIDARTHRKVGERHASSSIANQAMPAAYRTAALEVMAEEYRHFGVRMSKHTPLTALNPRSGP